LPTWEKTLALLKRVMSWVMVRVPKAAEPLAWTTRSGIRSRLKWAIFSISQ